MKALTKILNRFSGSVIFEADVDGETESIRIGLAVKLAIKTSADLYSANLRSANLSGADLRSADLRSADLYSANLRSADLYSANLSGANLSGADLRSADLRSADLSGANLRSANLSGADLRSADLSGANLRSADLRSANGVNKYLCTPLLMLHDQPGLIRAYKLVTSKNTGPCYPGITYLRDQEYEVADACCDETVHCGAGINLATLDWIMKEWHPGRKILIAEFWASDIAAIPTATDGKFRVHRCKIVGEKDLVELGLVKNEVEAVNVDA